MNKIKYIFIIILLIGCNSKRKRKNIEMELQPFFGKEIVFPDDLVLFTKDKQFPINQSILFKKESKIITIINGNCASCVESILKWESFRNSIIDKSKIDKVFFVIENSDLAFFSKVYSSSIPYNCQLVFDDKGYFIEKNELNKLRITNTFLLDSYNKIKLIGDPLISSELMSLYMKNL